MGIAPDDSEVLAAFATFLEESKEYERAEQMYLRAVQHAPQEANLLYNVALFYEERKKNYEEADDYYLRALEASPEDPTINESVSLPRPDLPAMAQSLQCVLPPC